MLSDDRLCVILAQYVAEGERDCLKELNKDLKMQLKGVTYALILPKPSPNIMRARHSCTFIPLLDWRWHTSNREQGT
eukprot:1320917-Amorphochlora_amoeboformis.AAC.1